MTPLHNPSDEGKLFAARMGKLHANIASILSETAVTLDNAYKRHEAAVRQTRKHR